ncbi:hypothetical protein ARMGADRAFT_948499, partial [Armillaria gallica]
MAVPNPDTDLASSSLSSLTGLVSTQLLGINLLPVVHAHISGDMLLSKVLAASSQFKNFTVENGLVYLRKDGRKLLCIPEHIRLQERDLWEIIISKAHSLVVHLGSMKMLAYLRDHVWWKS